MKKEIKHNHPIQIKPVSHIPSTVKSNKTPQATLSQQNNNKISYSVLIHTRLYQLFIQPGPQMQRDPSPMYHANHNFIQSKMMKNKTQAKKGSSNQGSFVNNSLSAKRMSAPKNVQKGFKLHADQSFNQTIGDESYYSGEGYITKSIGGPIKSNKSPQKQQNMKTQSKQSLGGQNANSSLIISKKRNSQCSQQNSNHHQNDSVLTTAFKQINNFLIDSNIDPKTLLSQQTNKQFNIINKGSKTTKGSGSVTNKSTATSYHNHSNKFGERRFSTKNQESNSQHRHQQYENLMLQQLMKQQKQSENAFKKKVSVISIDDTPTSNQAPHVLLNVSYNMNNNINHHADQNASYLFQQDPNQIKTFIGIGDSVQHDRSLMIDEAYRSAFLSNNASPEREQQKMSYDNTLRQDIELADIKIREKSFDQINNFKKNNIKKSSVVRSQHNHPIKTQKQYSRSNSGQKSSSKYKRENSSNEKQTIKQMGSSSNSSHAQVAHNKRSFQQMKIEKENIQDQNMIDKEDMYLLKKLDEALIKDLQQKTSSQKVNICSKVWGEIIRRSDPIIASLLLKIKNNYESHMTHMKGKIESQKKELNFEKELQKEKESRKIAEVKIDNLSEELKKQQKCISNQEQVILEMKKQIAQYRKEIIELSTSNKKNFKGNKRPEREMMIPKLDLSKVQRDSQDSENSQGELDEDFEEAQKKKKELTYQQYLQYMENDSQFDDMAQESQESLIRREELLQRKNKIIQLLNGEISDEENGHIVNQSSGRDETEQYDEDSNIANDLENEKDSSEIDLLAMKQQQQQQQYIAMKKPLVVGQGNRILDFDDSTGSDNQKQQISKKQLIYYQLNDSLDDDSLEQQEVSAAVDSFKI